MRRSEGPCSGMDVRVPRPKLAGCPLLVEVQWTLLQYCLRCCIKHHHYTPGFIQGIAIGNDCSHKNISFTYITFSHQVPVYEQRN